MSKYKLYINMPSAKFYKEIIADSYIVNKGRITFLSQTDVIASYPSRYTIIEEIIRNK